MSVDAVGKSTDELVAERDWLRRRVRHIGTFGDGTPQVGGRAANAMVEYALAGDWPDASALPRSESELSACLNTLADAPAHLRPRLDAVIRHYRKESGLDAAPTPPATFHGIPVADFVIQLEQGRHVVEPDMLPRTPADGYSPEPLLAEWQWLRERARMVGGVFGRDEQTPRSWGRSSNALVDYLLGGPRPSREVYPLDGSDLAACERALESAPPHLQAKGQLLLDDYRASLAPRPERPPLVDELDFDFQPPPRVSEDELGPHTEI